MAEPLLQEDERVLFTAHPGSWGLVGFYFWTLGLYGFWRRATYFMVTDHRVIRTKGLLFSKTQSNVPLEMVQDASLATSFGIGNVVLSSAGGPLSAQKLGPMKAETAREMVEVILRERKRARESVMPQRPAAPEAGAANDPMAQLKQLGELHDSGVLSQEEFEAKKAEILDRL